MRQQPIRQNSFHKKSFHKEPWNSSDGTQAIALKSWNASHEMQTMKRKQAKLSKRFDELPAL